VRTLSFFAGTALSWGVYVPVVHRAAFELISNLRAFMFVVFSIQMLSHAASLDQKMKRSCNPAILVRSRQALNCDWVLICNCA
jgi:hypothetical protein